MRKALEELMDAVECAIKSGDWKVDGACDPDSAIVSAKKALEQSSKNKGPSLDDLLNGVPYGKIYSIWVYLTKEQKYKAQEGCWYMDEFDVDLYAENLEKAIRKLNHVPRP